VAIVHHNVENQKSALSHFHPEVEVGYSSTQVIIRHLQVAMSQSAFMCLSILDISCVRFILVNLNNLIFFYCKPVCYKI
jgi:hypothetical protein